MEQAEYDEKRTAHLNAIGFSVLRFWNHDVFNNLDAVLEQISTKLFDTPSS